MITGLIGATAIGALLLAPGASLEAPSAPSSTSAATYNDDAADITLERLDSLPTAIVPVPNTIPSDCSVDVTKQLNSWMRSVPDGSTMTFQSDDCFRVDFTLYLTDRHDLALDGNGATIESGVVFPSYPMSTHHMINMLGGTDIVLRELKLTGTNPVAEFDRTRVWYHGINVEGVDGLLIDQITAGNFWGDFLHIAEDGRGPGLEKHAANIVLRDSSSTVVGRSQVSCTACDNVLITNSTFNDTGYQVFNIEVGYAAWHAQNIAFVGNDIGGFVHLSVLVNAGLGEYVKDVSFIGNTMTSDPVSCQAPVFVLDTDPEKSNFIFRDNNLRALGAGFRVGGVSGVTIEHNTVQLLPAGGCDMPGTAVRIKKATGTIKHNDFPGFGRVIEAPSGAATAGTSVCGNRLNGVGYNQPVAC